MAKARTIRILLADDHTLVREGIRASLAGHRSLRVIGEATTGKEALRETRQLGPDVVLMDLNMPEMGGLEATRLIGKSCPRVKVLALTVHESKEYVLQILRAGAQGYVLKDTSPEELVRAIESVARGEAYFSPRVSRVLLEDLVEAPEGPSGKNGRATAVLSGREKQVLGAIAQGCTSKEVASRLNLSVRTVETYRVRLKRKLEARNIADLLNRAREQELL